MLETEEAHPDPIKKEDFLVMVKSHCLNWDDHKENKEKIRGLFAKTLEVFKKYRMTLPPKIKFILTTG